jgi:hypothetical protein
MRASLDGREPWGALLSTNKFLFFEKSINVRNKQRILLMRPFALSKIIRKRHNVWLQRCTLHRGVKIASCLRHLGTIVFVDCRNRVSKNVFRGVRRAETEDVLSMCGCEYGKHANSKKCGGQNLVCIHLYVYSTFDRPSLTGSKVSSNELLGS